MKVLILAAGLGTRLKEYTQYCPKTMVKINGKPLLEYQLETLTKLSLRDITIVIGYQGEEIKKYIANHRDWSSFGITFVENDNPELQGTAYSVWLAREIIGKQPYLHLHSDLIFSEEIIQDLLNSPNPNAIILDKKVKLEGRAQRVLLDNDKIIRMQNTPLKGAIGKCVGIAKFSSEHFNYLMEKAREEFNIGNLQQSYYGLIGKNIQVKDFFIVDSKDYKLIEINTAEQLKMAERGFIRNEY